MKSLFKLFAIFFLCINIIYAQDNNAKCISKDYLPNALSSLNAGKAVVKNINANSQCTTNKTPKIIYQVENKNDAEEYIPSNDNAVIIKNPVIQDEANWSIKDSVHLKCYLPAGKNLGVKLNLHNWAFEKINSLCLSNEALAAVAKSPEWLRSALEYTLSQVSTAKQIELANIINNTTDPFIDEVAYSIAYSTPQFLSSDYCYPQLFLENAKLMYKHDSDLKYVDIVDYGSSTTDENYYSTTKYWRMDTNGNKVQYEVPKDVYYKYLVHPKGTDEIQTYIDETLDEYDYNNDQSSAHIDNISAPPTGSFWRNFLYNHTELIPDSDNVYFPILKDSISKPEVLWDPTNTVPQAMRVMTKWINTVIPVFDNLDERPHQPDRIYENHIGRCGEHEDIALSTARTCLVPCRGIEAFSSDHVWNEFWDVDDFQQWEPVNNSYYNRKTYSVGWGKKFGTVLCHTSTGVMESVTDLYCNNTSTFTVYALDKNNKPIDGARVEIFVTGVLDTVLTNCYFDNYSITDNQGKCTFIVESGHAYYYKLQTAIGDNPSGNYVNALNSKPIAGKSYSYKLKISSKAMPKPVYNTLTINDSTASNYKIEASYNVEKQVVNWLNMYDDLDSCYTTFEKDTASANLFFSDENNYNLCNSSTTFNSYSSIDNASNGTATFYSPSNETWQSWYAFINNSYRIANLVLVDATFKFYVRANANVDVKESNNLGISELYNNYPNPVIDKTQISFKLAQPALTQLNIINANGVVVRHLLNMQLDAKNHSFQWDSKDDSGNLVSPGVYVYTLSNSYETLVNKLVVIR